MKPKIVFTAIALTIAFVAFVGGIVFDSALKWTGGHYFVLANRQMIQTTMAASEDRDPRQCLALFQEYFERAAKVPWGIGYVHRNLLEFERAIWAIEETTPAKGGLPKESSPGE